MFERAIGDQENEFVPGTDRSVPGTDRSALGAWRRLPGRSPLDKTGNVDTLIGATRVGFALTPSEHVDFFESRDDRLAVHNG